MKKITLLFFVMFAFGFYSCDQKNDVDSLESTQLEFEESLLKKPAVKVFESLVDDSNINYCGDPIECKLIAGQHIDAGMVTVSNDHTNLYVKVYSKAGFQPVDENIKMWIGDEPPTRRPPAGHFPYKVTETGDTHIFEIPLEDLDFIEWNDEECLPNDLVIIVHADVLTEFDGGQTAFGGCDGTTGDKPWWAYMTYETQCCEEEEELIIGWFRKSEKPENEFSTCISDGDDYGFSNEIPYEWLKRITRSTIKYYAIYSNNTEGCDLEDRMILGYLGMQIYSDPSNGSDRIAIYIRNFDGYSDIKFKAYVGWEDSVINGDELNPSIVFDNGNIPNGIDVTIPTLILDKKVSDWSGTRPTPLANDYFFGVVKLFKE